MQKLIFDPGWGGEPELILAGPTTTILAHTAEHFMSRGERALLRIRLGVRTRRPDPPTHAPSQSRDRCDMRPGTGAGRITRGWV